MATNFASWSTSNQYGTYSYVLSYDLLSQSTANNTSTIRVYGTINLPVYVSWSRGSITINNASFGLATYYSAGSYTIGYTDITVAHNNDGTGSTYVSGSISTSYLMNGSCGGTIYLPTIPRASQPSCITYPNTTSDVGNIGDTITIHMNRKSTSFTHTVRYSWYNKNETIATNVTDNCRWTIPNDFAEDIPNDTKSWGTIFVDTYNGSTLIGTKSVVFWCHVADANPTFIDFEFEDLNSDTVALTGDNQAIIKGYSNIGIRIPVSDKAVANKGATMNKYRVVVGDYTEDLTYSDSSMVSSSTILKATTGTMNVYAIDSRNNSTLVTKLATREIDYTPATISSSSKVERSNSGVGENAILTYSGTFWNNSFGDETNAIESVSYEFKPTSSTTWITGTTDITPTISGSDFNFTGIVRSDAIDYTFDISTSYDFRITITDKLTTTVYVFTPLASGTPNLALAENGVGIMGAYNDNIGGPAQVGGNPLAYMPIGYIYISTNSTNPGDLFGGTWTQLEDRFLLGAGSIYTAGSTGGSPTHTLTIDEMPSHDHSTAGSYIFSGSGSSAATWLSWGAGSAKVQATGGGQPHSIMPPYLAVYMWERIA